MTDTPLPDLILYGRPSCGLCHDARELITALLAERVADGRRAPRFIERDIEDDPDWERAFLTVIPVVELGDRRLETVTSAARIRRLLADVLDPASAAVSGTDG